MTHVGVAGLTAPKTTTKNNSVSKRRIPMVYDRRGEMEHLVPSETS